jgi:hypothetical protein
MVNTEMNSLCLHEVWNFMSTGAAVDFAQKTDTWSLLFLIIFMTVMEGTYKTSAI